MILGIPRENIRSFERTPGLSLIVYSGALKQPTINPNLSWFWLLLCLRCCQKLNWFWNYLHIQCINAGGNHIIEGSVNQIKLEITCKSNSTFPTQSFPAVVAAAENLRIYFRLDLSEQRPAPNLPLPTLLYCFGQRVLYYLLLLLLLLSPLIIIIIRQHRPQSRFIMRFLPTAQQFLAQFRKKSFTLRLLLLHFPASTSSTVRWCAQNLSKFLNFLHRHHQRHYHHHHRLSELRVCQ